MIFMTFNNLRFFTNKFFANQLLRPAHMLRNALLKFCTRRINGLA